MPSHSLRRWTCLMIHLRVSTGEATRSQYPVKYARCVPVCHDRRHSPARIRTEVVGPKSRQDCPNYPTGVHAAYGYNIHPTTLIQLRCRRTFSCAMGYVQTHRLPDYRIHREGFFDLSQPTTVRPADGATGPSEFTSPSRCCRRHRSGRTRHRVTSLRGVVTRTEYHSQSNLTAL